MLVVASCPVKPAATIYACVSMCVYTHSFFMHAHVAFLLHAWDVCVGMCVCEGARPLHPQGHAVLWGLCAGRERCAGRLRPQAHAIPGAGGN